LWCRVSFRSRMCACRGARNDHIRALNDTLPAQLEALVQGIIQVADVVIPGPATGASLPSSMYSPNPNPMTVVVNGDLDLNGWKHTGYGLLLVRGHLNYDPDASWDGIVMVVGQGIVTGTKG